MIEKVMCYQGVGTKSIQTEPRTLLRSPFDSIQIIGRTPDAYSCEGMIAERVDADFDFDDEKGGRLGAVRCSSTQNI